MRSNSVGSLTSEKKIVDILRSQLEQGEVTFTHSPEFWAQCSLPVHLEWKPVQFTRNNQAKVPTRKGGVYGFVLRPSFVGPPNTAYLLYIGKTKGFKTRYRRYLFHQSPSGYKSRPHIHDMLNKWPEHMWFYYAPIDDLALLDEVEAAIRDSCIPPFNLDFKARVNTAVNNWRRLGSFR